MDSEALSRRVAELEKEKMMIELELKDIGAKHRADARNLEMQLTTLKDTESDLLQKIDLLTRDNADLQAKILQMQEDEEANANNNTAAVHAEDQPDDAAAEKKRLQKLLDTERVLKQQAVNKLAEIMNRKDFNKLDKNDKKVASKWTSAELRKKEKENRRIQQELTMEKEKFNTMVAR